MSRVRGRRRVGGQNEYLIAWKGYGPDGDTWEPEEHLGKPGKEVKALDKTVSVKVDASRYLVQETTSWSA